MKLKNKNNKERKGIYIILFLLFTINLFSDYEYTLHTGLNQINSLAFADDRKTAIIAGDKKIQIWDIENQRLKKELEFGSYVLSIAISGDGKNLASCGIKKQIKIWNTANWGLKENLEILDYALSIAYSPNCKYMAAGLSDGSIVKYYEENYVPEYEKVHIGAVYSVAVSDEGEIYSCGEDGKVIRLKENVKEELINTGKKLYSIALSKSNRYIAFGGSNSKIIVMNTESRDITEEKTESDIKNIILI